MIETHSFFILLQTKISKQFWKSNLVTTYNIYFINFFFNTSKPCISSIFKVLISFHNAGIILPL